MHIPLALVRFIWNCLQDESFPITFIVVILYTIAVEIIPKIVTVFNSNAYTSQIRWNVTKKAQQFQLVNYILYHQLLLSQWVHAITICIDAVLWIEYFYCLLREYSFLAYSVVPIFCLLQVMTLDDCMLKATLLAAELVFAIFAAVSHYIITYLIPKDSIFGFCSLILFLNAFLRAASHSPEPLPIDYLGLKNHLPIKNWFHDEKVRKFFYEMSYSKYAIAVLAAECSELQAGLPIRLLPSCLIMILCNFDFMTNKLDMKKLRERAHNIDIRGWHADEDARHAFDILDKDIVEMFAFEASIVSIQRPLLEDIKIRKEFIEQRKAKLAKNAEKLGMVLFPASSNADIDKPYKWLDKRGKKDLKAQLPMYTEFSKIELNKQR
jgi:hypothetical protein